MSEETGKGEKVPHQCGGPNSCCDMECAEEAAMSNEIARLTRKAALCERMAGILRDGFDPNGKHAFNVGPNVYKLMEWLQEFDREAKK